MIPSDAYCIGRCLDGHPDDFRFLVEQYERVLQAYLLGRLGDRERAEEVAQETFVRAYFNLDRLEKESSFCAWLMGIAKRVVKEQIKARQKERRLAKEWMAGNAENDGLAPAYPVEKAIAELPDPFREVVLLRYYGGQSSRQIAVNLKKPIGTVTKTLSRAYAMMREILREEEP